jgi:hypothetical protein
MADNNNQEISEFEKGVRNDPGGTESKGVRLDNKVWISVFDEHHKTRKSVNKIIAERVSGKGFLRVSEDKFKKMVYDIESIKVTNRCLAFIAEDYFDRLGKSADFDKMLDAAKTSKDSENSLERALGSSEEEFENMGLNLESIIITNFLLASIIEDYFTRLGKPGAYDKFIADSQKSKKLENL